MNPLERRIGKLEAMNPATTNKITAIILLPFRARGEPEPELTRLLVGDIDMARQEGEDEEAFTDRVEAKARESQGELIPILCESYQ